MSIKYLIIFLLFTFNNTYADTKITDDSNVDYASNVITSRSPRKTAEWKEHPTVVICKGAPTSTKDVELAVKWWRSIGYRFGSIIPSSIYYGCVIGSPNGKILIRLIDNRGVDPNNLATTYLYYNKTTGDILWAEILLREEPLQRVLEHEIGHALGWRHYVKSKHIMHPYLPDGGWNDDGLRNY